MSKMDEAMATVPPYLLDKLKEINKGFLTPGCVFGAAGLWSIILDHTKGSDPLEVLFFQEEKIKELVGLLDKRTKEEYYYIKMPEGNKSGYSKKIVQLIEETKKDIGG